MSSVLLEVDAREETTFCQSKGSTGNQQALEVRAKPHQRASDPPGNHG